jgi:hypothetical protein
MKNIDYLIFSKVKINNFLSFKSENSFEQEKNDSNIFPFLNKEYINNKKNSKDINEKLNNDEITKNNIVVEKGIIISPLCLASKSKYHFGSKKLDIKIPTNIKKNIKQNNNNIQIITTNKSRNNETNPLDKLSSKKTKISLGNNLFEKNKIKINGYKSRNKCFGLDEKGTFHKKKNFFTNETLSSCCKNLFEKKIFKSKDKKNFSLTTTHKIKQFAYTDFLNNKSKNRNNNKNNDYMHEYKYKTIYRLSNSKKRDYFNKRKHNYVFKCNPYIVTNKNIDFPEQLKLLNNNNLKSLQKESNKYFGSSFSLVQTEKFSYKFRNPLLNNNIINDNYIERTQRENIIKENIISGINIIKEIDDQKNKEKIILNKKKIDKNKLFAKFKSILIKNSNYTKHISLSPYELINKIIINNKANKNINYLVDKIKNISELIQAIKTKNLKKVNELIEKNCLCVRDSDIFKYTPLHWAVKKDFYLIIPKLISFGAQVNAQNFLGETALHLSVKKNNYECTVLLLIFLASPFIKNNKGKKPFDYTKDYQMGIIYKKITDLHYKSMFVRNKLIYDNIQNEFIRFILDEFSTQIKKDCLIIVEDIEREKRNRDELESKFKKNDNLK